jgi:hypothetical protein
MDRRLILILILAAIAIAMAWLTVQTSETKDEAELSDDDWIADSRFDFGDSPDNASDADSTVQRIEYIQTYGLKEIATEFPVHAGMTLSEMDSAVAANQRSFDASHFEQKQEMYNLGWEQRSISNGTGCVYFWVNFKYLFHCDIVIESGTVQSIWVMPGNAEWATGIYYRIAGNGSHKGPCRIR